MQSALHPCICCFCCCLGLAFVAVGPFSCLVCILVCHYTQIGRVIKAGLYQIFGTLLDDKITSASIMT